MPVECHMNKVSLLPNVLVKNWKEINLNDRVECDILHPIYPNRKESCDGVLEADTEQKVAVKYCFGKKNNKKPTN